MDFVDAGEALRERAEDAGGSVGNEKAESGASESENEDLGDKLRDDGGVGRGERVAKGDFGAALGGTRQEQRGDVGAGDQKEKRYRGEEGPKRTARAADGEVFERLDFDTEIGIGLG